MGFKTNIGVRIGFRSEGSRSGSKRGVGVGVRIRDDGFGMGFGTAESGRVGFQDGVGFLDESWSWNPNHSPENPDPTLVPKPDLIVVLKPEPKLNLDHGPKTPDLRPKTQPRPRN